MRMMRGSFTLLLLPQLHRHPPITLAPVPSMKPMSTTKDQKRADHSKPEDVMTAATSNHLCAYTHRNSSISTYTKLDTIVDVLMRVGLAVYRVENLCIFIYT